MISFQCENCEKRLKAPPEKAGKRVKCPNCGEKTIIPSPVEESPVEEALVEEAPIESKDQSETQQLTEEPVTDVAPPAENVETTENEFGFTPADPTASVSPSRRKVKKGRKWVLPAVIWIVLLSTLGGLVYLKMNADPPAPELANIAAMKGFELEPITFTAKVKNPKDWGDKVTFHLVESPPGASIDEKSGMFSWKPTEEQAPVKLKIKILARVEGRKDLWDQKTFSVTVKEQNEPPTIYEIQNLEVEAGNALAIEVKAEDFDIPKVRLKYAFGDTAPKNARIDPSTGAIYWKTEKNYGAGHYRFQVKVTEAVPNGLTTTKNFQVRVSRPDGPVDRLIAKLEEANLEAALNRTESFPPFNEDPKILIVDGETVRAFEYFSTEAADDAVAQIAPDCSTLFDKPMKWEEPIAFFRNDRVIAMYSGSNKAILDALNGYGGKPFATAALIKEPPKVTQKVTTEDDEGDKAILSLYKRKRIIGKTAYKELRKIYSDRFEKTYADEIRTAYGRDYDTFTKWLNDNLDIKEEFYTAIDQQVDNVPACLAIFKSIKEKFPRQIEEYANLAIAIAITWDDERGVYDYTRHQVRTKSNMPEQSLQDLANFEFFLENEKVMQGRAQFLPWEFLKHLVNHKTPAEERRWALLKYLSHRTMFGKCYHDVPYDNEMLATQSRVAKLNDKDYTLPNLQQFGGVCAMQADYAARVGKSMGVPAEYVRGESNSGGWHAWVMWVEIRQVNKSGIGFTLESHGRYRGDKYYVGELLDPQTGQWITDRQMELRLHTVGSNPVAKRHAALIMKSYPMLKEKGEMTPTDQFVFLNRVVDLCPGNEQAWISLAKISKQEDVGKKNFRQMSRALDKLFTTFQLFPDFTWIVFDDLVTFQKDVRKRNELYARLVALYEQAGRPDLACEARLKLTDYLVEEKRTSDAIEGLAYTIKKFPDEGRYVPRLLDRLEVICKEVQGAQSNLILFYKDFLPTVPQMRGDTPSKYCMSMFQRGIALFKNAGQDQLAATFQAELTKIQNGMGRRKQ